MSDLACGPESKPGAGLILALVIAASCAVLGYLAGEASDRGADSEIHQTRSEQKLSASGLRNETTLHGIVVSSDGAPVANAEVSMLCDLGQTSGPLKLLSIQPTDEFGFFLVPVSRSPSHARTWVLATHPRLAPVIRLLDKQNSDPPVILVLGPPATVLGKVRMMDGSSVAGASLASAHCDGPEPSRTPDEVRIWLQPRTISEADGTFRMQGIRPGLIDIHVLANERSTTLRIIAQPGVVVRQDIYVDSDRLRLLQSRYSDLSEWERRARNDNGPSKWLPDDLCKILQQCPNKIRREVFSELKGRIADETGNHPPVATSLRKDLMSVATLGLNDPSNEVRTEALLMLCYMNDPANMGTLLRCLNASEWEIRYYAAMGLGWIGRSAAARDAVCSSLRDCLAPSSPENLTMKSAVASSLQDLGEVVDPEVYYDTLRSWDAQPAQAALALAKMGKKDAVELILARLERAGRDADYHLSNALSILTGQRLGRTYGPWRDWYAKHQQELPPQRR